jgi:hypothetical protein
MHRSSFARLKLLTAFAFCGLQLPSFAFAQNAEPTNAEPRRTPRLSQRLEQFRKDLLGAPVEEESIDPVVKSVAPPSQSHASTKQSVNVKGYPTPATAPKRTSTSPASRIVTREAPPITEGSRLAARPQRHTSTFVEAVPGRGGDDDLSSESLRPVDETRLPSLTTSSARPARRGGAFELPTPRVARSVQAEHPTLAADADGESQPETELLEEVPRSSSGGNVLFTAKSPMLSVEASGPRKILVGREAEFNVSLRNVGEVVASGVIVKINIPAYVEVISADPSVGTAAKPMLGEQARSLEWKLDRLDTRGQEALRLKLIPRKSVPLDLAMQWNCQPESSQAVVEVQEPKIALSISGPSEVFYGQSKIYKLTIANPGNGDAENVNVSLLPIGTSGEPPANYRLGILRAGDSKSIDIELTARQAGTLEIKAQAFGDGGLRADVVEPVVVRRGQLKIAMGGSKVKYAGTPGVYRIRIANAGDAASEGVTLSAMLPPDAKFLKASHSGKFIENSAKVVWEIGTMQPGDDRTFDMHCVLNSPGENALQGIVQSSDELTATSSTTTQVEALADLKMEVRDPRGPVAIGDDAVYEVVIRNRGTKSAEGIDLVTYFSEGLEASSVEGIDHQIAAGQVTMKTIPAIAPASEAMVRIHCTSDRGGNLVFRAEMTCRNPGTKLAAEETTHFYGDERAVVADPAPQEPQEAAETEAVELQEQEAPQDDNLTPPNRYSDR